MDDVVISMVCCCGMGSRLRMAAYWGGSVGFLRSLLGRSLSALAFPRADGGCTTGGVTCGGRDTAGGGTTGAGLMAGRCGPLRDGAGCGVGGVRREKVMTC